MKTLNLSDLDCAALYVVLTKRLLELRLDELSFERLGKSSASIHSEIVVIDSLLSKLG